MRKAIATFAGVVISGMLMAAAPAALADDGFKPGTTIRNILTDSVGKKVGLRLESHEEIEGVVVAVGDQLVKIGKVTGRDYFDAYVAIDHVSAVIVRSR